jgi:hypothetical protein
MCIHPYRPPIFFSTLLRLCVVVCIIRIHIMTVPRIYIMTVLRTAVTTLRWWCGKGFQPRDQLPDVIVAQDYLYLMQRVELLCPEIRLSVHTHQPKKPHTHTTEMSLRSDANFVNNWRI